VDAVGLEVGPDLLEKTAGIRSLVERRRIAYPCLARLQSFVVGSLVGFARRDIADLLESEGDRVGGPDVDGVSQDRVDRLRHVEVAHASACDARRTRAGTRLVDDNDVRARPRMTGLELHRQMPRRRQTMYSGADDDVAHGCGNGIAHRTLLV